MTEIVPATTPPAVLADTVSIIPVTRTFHPPPAGTTGAHHRVDRRDEIGLLLREAPRRGRWISFRRRSALPFPFPRSIFSIIDRFGGTITETDQPRLFFVRFPDEAQLKGAIGRLDLARAVEAVGPLISRDPPGFLTDQLLVRFADADAVDGAIDVLRRFDLDVVRPVPYIEHGFLLQRDGPADLDLYEAAEALIRYHDAIFAIPNLYTIGRSACSSHTYGAVHSDHEYLDDMRVCDARPLAVIGRADPLVAVLDEGVTASGLRCTRLAIDAAIDLGSMNSCQTRSASEWCNDPDCADVWSSGSGAHGNQMSLLLGGTLQVGSDLEGVAPGIGIISARRNIDPQGPPGDDIMTTAQLADALWWLVGGDPEWCFDTTNYECQDSLNHNYCLAAGDCESTFPPRLNRGASVLNLSFTREDFLEAECPAATCYLVCENPATCGYLIAALARIRSPRPDDGIRCGGALTVAAVGNNSSETTPGVDCRCYDSNGQCTDYVEALTDIARYPATLAVGSVSTVADSSLPYVGDCLIQFAGDFLDVVAPTGGLGGTTYCSTCGPLDWKTGESSAATAAVSGVAALMFRANPLLTAPQAHCILRETAQRLDGSAENWNTLSSFDARFQSLCAFDASGHSDCMGRGMVDAEAAVDAARACRSTTPGIACPCTKDGHPARGVTFVGADLSIFDPLDDRFLALLFCMLNGGCPCPRLEPCVTLSGTNPDTRPWRGAQLQICMEDTCHELATVADWDPGETASIPIQVPDSIAGPIRRASDATIRVVLDGEIVWPRPAPATDSPPSSEF